MNLIRIWAIASNGFREVIRDRILYFIGFFALLLMLAMRLLPEIATGTDDKIFIDLGLAAIGLLSAVVTIFVGTALINKEIEKRTLLILIPKPISRIELIIGKHLGLWATVTVMVAIMSSIYFGLLSLSGTTYRASTIGLSIIYLLIELSLLTAVAILFGVFTSSILATLLSFGVYLMGHFSRDLVELGKLSDNPNVTALTKTLYLILPDLSRLNFRNEAVYGMTAMPDATELLGHASYGILYTVLVLAIAILIFTQRQF